MTLFIQRMRDEQTASNIVQSNLMINIWGVAYHSTSGVLDNPLGSCGFPLGTIALPLLSDGNLLGVLRIWRFHHREDGLNNELGI